MAQATPQHYAGRPIVEVLQELRAAGITILYSEDLLPRSLTVKAEPHAIAGEALLAEILKPYDLQPNKVADNVYAIAAAPRESHPSPPRIEPLEQVIVTTSRYAVAGRDAMAPDVLTQSTIHTSPSLAEETLRSVQRLPGMAGNGFSARASIRGGEPSETLVLLDGLPLEEPFHLKNFLTPVSVLDSRMVQSMDVYAGAFPVNYGGRMSAVIDAHSHVPVSGSAYELGVSTFHVQGLFEQTFADDRAYWLVAARRSNLELIRHFIESDYGEPEYIDAFAKVGYKPDDATDVALHVLSSHDSIFAKASASQEEARADYRNNYVWGTLDRELSHSLSLAMTVSYTDIENERAGSVDDPLRVQGSVDDERAFQIAGLTGRLTHGDAGQVQQVGMEARYVRGDYDYGSVAQTFATPLFAASGPTERSANVRPHGWEYALYANAKVALGERWVGELGLRWDDETYTPDATELAPRVSVRYDVTPATQARVSWGRFYQAQDISELQVQDNITRFFPAERADHTVASIEHKWSASQLRVELYHKTYDHLRPRFENLFDPIVLLPELRADRVEVAPSSARVAGLDLLYAVHSSGPWSGSLSYSWSQALDHINGSDVPRSWDQRHAVNALLMGSWRRYDVSIADTFHTGWPTTAVTAEPGANGLTYIIGRRNGARVNTFNSLDVRVARHSEFAGGHLEFFAEVTNLLNRKNLCCTDYRTTLSNDLLDPHAIYWLGAVPSVGVLWRR